MRQPLDHLRSRKKPVSRPVWIIHNDDLADQLQSAQSDALRLRTIADQKPKETQLSSRADEAEEEVERLREELRDPDNSTKFVGRSIGRKAFDDLQNLHLPTPDQKKDAKKDGIGELAWNPDTFPPALILECVSIAYLDDETQEEVLEPLTEDFVKEIWESAQSADGEASTWNHAEVMSLFTAAYEANQTRRVIDLGNGSRRTRS